MTKDPAMSDRLCMLLEVDISGLRNIVQPQCTVQKFVDAMYGPSSLGKEDFVAHVRNTLGRYPPGKYYVGHLDHENAEITAEGKGQVMCLLPAHDHLGAAWRDFNTEAFAKQMLNFE